MSDALKQIARRWFQEVWNEGKLETIGELSAPGAFGHGVSMASAEPVAVPDGFRDYVVQLRSAFPDLRIDIEDAIAEGDLVCVRCTCRGTHSGEGLMNLSPTGRSFEITGITILRIESGRIVEGWNNYDFLGMFEQLGLACRP